MNVIPFTLKKAIGQLSAGPGRMVYDRVTEAIRFAGNFRGDAVQFIDEPPPMIDLPQKSVSRIHYKPALIFGGGTLVIRLRNGKRNDFFETFSAEEIEILIHRRDVEAVNELVTEVKFDLFDDTFDDMLESMDDLLESDK